MALLIVLCILPWPTHADGLSKLAAVFERHNARGTLAIQRLSDAKRWVHNSERAARPFIPASTFKIVHTVIALDLGIEPDVDSIIPWDGKVRRIRSWNRPQSLRDAIRHSAVPVYQNIARRIGPARMGKAIEAAGYGNRQVGKQIDRFWLSGPLRISANAQIAFLEKLHGRRLPFSKRAQDLTVEIMERERGANFVHRGKTGWEIASKPAVGWYVGWHEVRDDVIFFALNMDMEQKHHGRARISIAIESLKKLKLY